MNPLNNNVQQNLKLLGLLTIILSVIAGFGLGDVPKYPGSSSTEFSFLIAIPYWMAGFVSALFLYALARAIDLLESINYCVKQLDSNTEKILNKFETIDFSSAIEK